MFSTVSIRFRVCGVLLDVTRKTPDVADTHALASPEQVLEALAEGPDVDIENLDFHFRIVLLEHDRALHRVHAADVRAVGTAPPLGAGPHALDEGDGLGDLAVRQADDLAARSARRH